MGATERLEELGLPGPSRHVGDDSSRKAWIERQGGKEDPEHSEYRAIREQMTKVQEKKQLIDDMA